VARLDDVDGARSRVAFGAVVVDDVHNARHGDAHVVCVAAVTPTPA
jgi:hypothetical protein